MGSGDGGGRVHLCKRSRTIPSAKHFCDYHFFTHSCRLSPPLCLEPLSGSPLWFMPHMPTTLSGTIQLSSSRTSLDSFCYPSRVLGPDNGKSDLEPRTQRHREGSARAPAEGTPTPSWDTPTPPSQNGGAGPAFIEKIPLS